MRRPLLALAAAALLWGAEPVRADTAQAVALRPKTPARQSAYAR